jgi:hypothetical protein
VRKCSAFLLRCVFVLCLCTLAGSLKPAGAQTKPSIMSWGENETSWNTALGINTMREACSIVPTSCEPYLDNLAALSGAKTYYVSFPLNLNTSVSWAKEYSTLSLTHKGMVEIGFDDFVNGMEGYQETGALPTPATTFISNVIAATKSANPNLMFGATIYEDSLTHTSLTSLPASLRAQIQCVHLYVHYRENAPNWATYVTKVKSLFPNAKVIAGAYPFDRIDYLPCAYQGTVKCTAAQEQSLYKELLQEQLTMANAGTVAGLEFYFGYFGDPQNWGGWTGRVCLASRVSECIANTNTLQNITLQVLKSNTAAYGASPTTVSFGSQTLDKMSAQKTITFTNTGTAPLTISTINYTASDFHMTDGCPDTVSPGQSCPVWVTFTPSALGTRTGSVTIRLTANGSVISPQVVALTGVGVD